MSQVYLELVRYLKELYSLTDPAWCVGLQTTHQHVQNHAMIPLVPLLVFTLLLILLMERR